jgi:hypothetical protein
VQENQWLLKLHTYGLLNNSFQPGDEVRVRRTYWRQRADQVRAASICIQRMQTVLAEMNLQLANVISDLGGVSGMAIVRAILSVERDGEKLANLANRVIRASKETKYTATETAHALPRRIRKPKGNAHRFDLETEPQRIMGVDLTRIDGIDVLTTQTLISETGTDMGRRKTEARSASWLGLCTDNRISGDKILCCGTRSVLNKTATALRMAATAPC